MFKCEQCKAQREKRVLLFLINRVVNAGLFSFLNNMALLDKLRIAIMHMAVDWNKDRRMGEYPFSPVLEFHILNPSQEETNELISWGFSFGSSLVDKDPLERVYYEFMQPCPPFGNC